METSYSVEFFIRKFQAIPEEKWCVFTRQDTNGRRCALGHISVNFDSPELNALHALMPFRHLTSDFSFMAPAEGVAPTNNGTNPRYQQPTPKERILAALYDVKKMQEPKPEVKPEVVERIVYVTVDEKVRELQKVSNEN